MPLPNNALTLEEIAQMTDAQRVARLKEYIEVSRSFWNSKYFVIRAFLGCTENIAPEHSCDKLSALTPGE